MKCLAMVAMCGGNCHAAQLALAEAGVHVPRRTLASWLEANQELYKDAVEIAMADKEGSIRSIVEAFKLRMMSVMATADAMDCARIVDMMTKLQALAAGKATERVDVSFSPEDAVKAIIARREAAKKAAQ